MTTAQERTPRRKKGRVVKLSHFVANYLKARGTKGESFDSVLRRHFGLADRKGQAQPLSVFYIVPGTPPQVSADLADARGRAIVSATKRGLKKAVAVLTVREVPWLK